MIEIKIKKKEADLELLDFNVAVIEVLIILLRFNQKIKGGWWKRIDSNSEMRMFHPRECIYWTRLSMQ